MKKHIPNFITSMNLFSGCLAVLFAFRGEPLCAAYFILISAVLDFADGFAARLLHAYSEIGKELDSLADVVSFGVAPAAILYGIMGNSLSAFLPGFSPENPSLTGWIFLLIPFLIPVFSALRLAKFNIDERQTSSFLGLPTPANALFFLSLVFWENSSPIENLLPQPWVLTGLILFFCFLLVSEIPMFSLKTKNFSWKGNEIRILFLVTSLILFGFFRWKALTIIILIYVCISVLSSFISPSHGTR